MPKRPYWLSSAIYPCYFFRLFYNDPDLFQTYFFSSFQLSALSPSGLKRSRKASPARGIVQMIIIRIYNHNANNIDIIDGDICEPGLGLCRSQFCETSSAPCTAQNLIEMITLRILMVGIVLLG